MKFKTTLVTMMCSIFLLYGIVHATPYTNSSSRYTINDVDMVEQASSDNTYTQVALNNPKISAIASTTLGGSIAVETWQDTNTSDGISTNAFGYWTDPQYTVATAGIYSFDFAITGGEISMIDESTLTHPPDQNAVLCIDVTLNGFSIWGSDNELYGSGVSHNYTVNGTDIGGTEFHTIDTPGDHYFGVIFDEYSETLNLGYYEVGDRIDLDYSMSANTRNYDNNWAGICAEGGMFGNLHYNDNTTAPIPEPATLFLMGAGLFGLIGSKRKKFNKKI